MVPHLPMAQNALSVLRYRPFRLYWAGQAVSLTGTWMQVMAQGWVITSLSADAWTLGAFNLAGSIPMLLLGVRGGELADRLDKKTILLWSQAAMMALAFAFAGLLYSGALQLWHVFAFGLVVSVVEAFEFPASQGMAPELVDPPDIPQAVAMMQTIFQAGRLVGPALAGFLIARWGEASAFVANGLSFLAVIVSLLLIRRGQAPRAPQAHDKASGKFALGFAYVRGDAITRALLGLLTLCVVLVFPTLVMMPFYARHVLQVDAVGQGELLSVSGLGALVGSLILLRASSAAWRQRLWVSVVGVALCMALMAVAPDVRTASVAVCGLSLAIALLMGSVNQTVQARVPAELRGRVSALFGMVFTSVLPFAALALTALADVVGMRQLTGVSAGAFVVASVVLLLQTRKDTGP